MRADKLTSKLQISPAALDLLGNARFDPVYGARPLRRVIQNQLETPLAKEILSGNYAAGETISIDSKQGSLVFGIYSTPPPNFDDKLIKHDY